MMRFIVILPSVPLSVLVSDLDAVDVLGKVVSPVPVSVHLFI